MIFYCDKDFKLAEKYVSIALSMDKLYRSKSSDSESSFSSEGLIPVVLNKFNVIENYENWNDAKDSLKELYYEYSTLENDIRRNYMLEQIASTLLIGEWVFEKKELMYRHLVQNLLHVDPNPTTYRQILLLHKKLDILLSNKNYTGNLKEKVKAWREHHVIKKTEINLVLNELIVKAKEESIEFGIKEIGDLNIVPTVVYDVPYSAYIDFLGNVMQINGDLEYTYQDLKHLIAHETFPGHSAHMEIRRQKVESGEIPLDATLVFTNTASSPVYEGIADNGMRFLGWDKSIDDEINNLLQVLKSTSSYSAAHMLHVENKDVSVVKQYLKEYAFMNDAAVDSKIRFVSHPFRKTFIYSYWRGNEAVCKAYNSVSKEQFIKFYNYLYGNMHSINTVNQFNSII